MARSRDSGQSGRVRLLAVAVCSIAPIACRNADECNLEARSDHAELGDTVEVTFAFPLGPDAERVELYPLTEGYLDFDARLWALDEASISHVPAEVRAAFDAPDVDYVESRIVLTLRQSDLIGTIGSSSLGVRLTTEGIGCV